MYKRPEKRIFDLLFSLFFLATFSPIYLLISILVKCTSTGPVFYKGLRMGQNGKLIHCWKFRTMCLNADEKLHQILKTCPELNEEWKKYFKLKNDPRLTPIGKFLRKSSLDELPQIWNVLKGDLSIVGPRPIAIENREKAGEEIRSHFGDKTDKILSVKPGLTCIWQIKGRNLLTFEERILLEEKYVDTQSFGLDLFIILKTVPIILFPKGAF
ncbi:MAG TPA: sugar transferase [Rhabdochlamydiaceae bacterium]|nr:sugar transferase [Rhabdochlamydiaceae bacterium]